MIIGDAEQVVDLGLDGAQLGSGRVAGRFRITGQPQAANVDEQALRVERRVSVFANRAQHDRRPEFRCQHHHPHDALRVDLQIVTDDGDVALELPSRLHDLGGGTRMYSQLVDDLYFALWHQVSTE